MFGKSTKKNAVHKANSSALTKTDWTDMVALSKDLYKRVVGGCNFAIGVVVLEPGMLSNRLQFRLNQEFSVPSVVEYVRNKLKPSHLEKMFKGDGGLIFDDKYGLHRVKGPDLGLPLNTLVALIEGAKPSHRLLVIFGGERLEGRLESRIQIMSELLTKAPLRGEALRHGSEFNALLERLKAIQPKRLFDYELGDLAALVNELEEHKEEIPTPLRPRFAQINQYIVKRRLGPVNL